MDIESINITNLVFEGGGSKGAAYAGSVQILDELNLLPNIRHIGGTSAGSITAAILATGGGSKGLTESIKHTHFSQFLDDRWGVLGDIKRAIFNYGLHTGHQFVDILKSLIDQFSGSSDLTFRQLDTLADEQPDQFKKLKVVTSNLTRQQPQVFDSENSPNLPIWLAVRASMSIPLIFEPVCIDGEYHVDGGLAWNYPIDLYDESTTRFNKHTLGFYLEPQQLTKTGKAFKTTHYNINSLKKFALGLGSYLYETANSKHIHPEDRKRTIFIDDLGVDGTNFSISKETIDALIESGRKATKSYFEDE